MMIIMDRIIFTFHWAIAIVAGLALLLIVVGIIAAILALIALIDGREESIFYDWFEASIGNSFIGVGILLSLGIPAILLKIMDDIKAMRKLQEEQAKKD